MTIELTSTPPLPSVIGLPFPYTQTKYFNRDNYDVHFFNSVCKIIEKVQR